MSRKRLFSRHDSTRTAMLKQSTSIYSSVFNIFFICLRFILIGYGLELLTHSVQWKREFCDHNDTCITTKYTDMEKRLLTPMKRHHQPCWWISTSHLLSHHLLVWQRVIEPMIPTEPHLPMISSSQDLLDWQMM